MTRPVRSKRVTFETVEPLGKRILIRKDEDKRETKGGIQLPDNIEIPTLTGRTRGPKFHEFPRFVAI